jgi:pyrroloquinoline quinone (PQQ) biosynthesis protein C
MGAFKQLVAATALDYESHILNNRLFRQLGAGQATRDQYVVYLRETYHLVRHTSRVLALAAAHVGDERRELRAWLIEQAKDEHGHELFCLKDLRHLGLAAERIVGDHPGPAAWGFFTQNYYLAAHGNPAALLGVASATEGMGAQLAGDLATTLSQRYGIPDSATTFLRSHAGFDKRHFEEATAAIDTLVVSPQEFADVAHARRMTFRYYGQLFSEVANSNEKFFESALAA